MSIQTSSLGAHSRIGSSIFNTYENVNTMSELKEMLAKDRREAKGEHDESNGQNKEERRESEKAKYGIENKSGITI